MVKTDKESSGSVNPLDFPLDPGLSPPTSRRTTSALPMRSVTPNVSPIHFPFEAVTICAKRKPPAADSDGQQTYNLLIGQSWRNIVVDAEKYLDSRAHGKSDLPKVGMRF